MEIKDIESLGYTFDGKFYFKNNNGDRITVNKKDALTIAYTLFDYANQKYDILEEIEDKICED